MKNICVMLMLGLLVKHAVGQGAVDRKKTTKAVVRSEAQKAADAARKAAREAAITIKTSEATAATLKAKAAEEVMRNADAAMKAAAPGPAATKAAEAVKKAGEEAEVAAKAAEEAAKAVKAADKAAASVSAAEGEDQIDNNYLSINTGLYLLNPYEIGESNRLERGDAEAPFFIEFAFNNAWAWNPSRRQYTWAANSSPFFDFSRPLDHMDFQTKLSFFLHDSGNKTTNASAIVGSGDFSAEATLTFNIYQGLFGPADRGSGESRAIYDETTLAQSIGVVTSYGGVTDRAAFDIHHRIFAGLGYKGAFRTGESDSTSVPKELLYNIQMGYAWIEQTQFLNGDTREIKLTQGDLPLYKLEGGFAIETELYWRITKTSFLFVGARLYANHDPNPWSAHMGVTIAADKVADLLGL